MQTQFQSQNVLHPPDTTSGAASTNYDFLFREYSIQGRWPSPDPAGLAAVSLANPQSWNRYAYVLNNPLTNTDPTGLYCVYLDAGGDGLESIDNNSSSEECGGSGGYWIAGEYGGGSQISINSDLGLVSGYGYLDGSWQYSVAGAQGSNAWGAWTQTVGGPPSDPFGGNTSDGGGPAVIDPVQFSNSVLQGYKNAFKQAAVTLACKDKESTRILTSMRNGAIVWGAKGAYTGFVSGEALGGSVTFGTSGILGGAGGALIGGTAGAFTRFIRGAVIGQVCSSLGAYN